MLVSESCGASATIDDHCTTARERAATAQATECQRIFLLGAFARHVVKAKPMLDRRFYFGELMYSQFPQLANELYSGDRDDVLCVEGPFPQ